MSLTEKWEAYKKCLQLGETPVTDEQLRFAHVTFFSGALAYNEMLCAICDSTESQEDQDERVKVLIDNLNTHLDEALMP